MSKPGIPINLPPRVERGGVVKADDFNSVRAAVARLARNGMQELPRLAPIVYKHPWKISVVFEESELRLRVGYGAIQAARMNNAQPTIESLQPFFDPATPTYLSGDPYFPSATVGFSVLTENCRSWRGRHRRS
jgi:hypothetical protein